MLSGLDSLETCISSPCESTHIRDNSLFERNPSIHHGNTYPVFLGLAGPIPNLFFVKKYSMTLSLRIIRKKEQPKILSKMPGCIGECYPEKLDETVALLPSLTCSGGSGPASEPTIS
jgi:hypothetical protein